LQKAGWIEGSNIHSDARWVAEDADRSRHSADELISLTPDVLLASGSPSVSALQRIEQPPEILTAVDPQPNRLVVFRWSMMRSNQPDTYVCNFLQGEPSARGRTRIAEHRLEFFEWRLNRFTRRYGSDAAIV
jgi:hypothetical protein